MSKPSQARINEMLCELKHLVPPSYIGSAKFHPTMKADGIGVQKGVKYGGGSWNDPEVRSKNLKSPSNDCFYVVCGEEPDLIVWDIDEPDAPHLQPLIDVLDRVCDGMYVATRQGRHYHTRYHPDIPKPLHFKALDILSNGSHSYEAPCHYLHPKDGSLIEYKWVGGVPSLRDDWVKPEVSIDLLDALKALQPKKPKLVLKKAHSGAGKDEDDDDKTTSTTDPTTDSTEDPINDIILSTHPKRLDNYNDWFRLCGACKREGVPFDTLIETSKRSKHWSASSIEWCRDKWNSVDTDKAPTRKTLLWWLSQDDPTQYERFVGNDDEFPFPIASHRSVAEWFKTLFPDSYIYSASRKEWMCLNKFNYWVGADGGGAVIIKKHLADVLVSTVDSYIKAIKAKLASGKMDKTTYNSYMTTAKKCRCEFESNGFLTGAIALLQGYYLNTEFDLNENHNIRLLAFNNGVINLDDKEFVLRVAEPTDYITTTTGYDYPTTYNADAEAEVIKFVNSIFGDKDVALYVLRVLASCLRGLNTYHDFYIFEGIGGNGKSALIDLISKVFGNYFGTLEAASITTATNSAPDAPNAPLYHTRHKRFVSVSEPDASKRLNVPLIKQLTGGDIVKTRLQHKAEVISFIPHYKLFVGANQTQATGSSTTAGYDRRVKLIKFPYRFCDTPRLAHERPIDRTLEDKLHTTEWRDALLWILLKVFQSEVQGSKSLHPPASVLESVKEHIAENDDIGSYIEQYCDTKTATDRDRLSGKEIYEHFKLATNTRRTENDFNRVLPRVMELRGIKKVKTSGRNLYVGIKLRDIEAMEDEEATAEA